MGKFKETRKRLFHPAGLPDNTLMETHYPMYDENGEQVGHPVRDDDYEELELDDYQVQRCDEIYNAALEFCRVITQKDDLTWSMYSLGEIVEYACAMILTDPLLGIDEIFFPSIVTDENGNEHIEEFYHASDYEFGKI